MFDECNSTGRSPQSHKASSKAGLALSFMLYPHRCGSEFVDLDHEIDWMTAHLAILDIFLLLDRCVDQQGETFPAIGTLNHALNELINHDAGRIRSKRPLSVE